MQRVSFFVDFRRRERAAAGKRRPHELIDNFYVELTSSSVAAALQAMKSVASHWQSGHMAAPKLRTRRQRFFRSVARTVQRQKLVKVASKAAKATKKIPQLKPGPETIEPIAANLTRSRRGHLCIRQQMMALKELDGAQNPHNQAVSRLDGHCRLKLLVKAVENLKKERIRINLNKFDII